MNLDWAGNAVLLIINALAAFRITRLLIDDAFPFGVLRSHLIDWANDHWGPYRRTYQPRPDDHEPTAADGRALRVYGGTAPLAYLISCYWCAGAWVSVAVTVLASTGPWWNIVAVPLALSAAVGILARASD